MTLLIIIFVAAMPYLGLAGVSLDKGTMTAGFAMILLSCWVAVSTFVVGYCMGEVSFIIIGFFAGVMANVILFAHASEGKKL